MNTKTIKELKQECTRLDRAVKEEEYKLKCVREKEMMHVKKGIELNLIELRLQYINNNKPIEDQKEVTWLTFAQETDPKSARKIKALYNKICKELILITRRQEKNLKNIQQNQKVYLYNHNRLLHEKQYDVDGNLWALIKKRNEAYDIWFNQKKIIDDAKANLVHTRFVSNTRFESNMSDVCGICLENHTTKNTIITNCKHQFGQECFQKWTQCCTSSNKSVCCPMCKKMNPKVFTFCTKPKEKEKEKETI